MKTRSSLIVMFCLAFAVISCKKERKKPEVPVSETITVHKIISLNGAVTEIISALGHASEIIGVDVTSTFPESVKSNAKDLGHVRSLSIESIMALQPTLILGTDKDLSPELLKKIGESGIETHIFNQQYTVEGTKKLIEAVAVVLKNQDYTKLQAKIDNQLQQVQPIANAPKVLFIYARGMGTLMVAGKNTPVEKVISLAGGQNAITAFEDFKPLTPESLLKSNPDVLLLFNSGLESLQGIEGLLKIQGIEKTNAGKKKKVLIMDGQLLSGFGPRLGEAAATLNQLLLNNAK